MILLIRGCLSFMPETKTTCLCGIHLMLIRTNSATVFSIVRLYILATLFNKTLNPTRDMADVNFWSTMETAFGHICACLPSLLILFTLCRQALQPKPDLQAPTPTPGVSHSSKSKHGDSQGGLRRYMGPLWLSSGDGGLSLMSRISKVEKEQDEIDMMRVEKKASHSDESSTRSLETV